MPSVTPADVLARRRRLILSGDADGFADLFAPDAVIEAPFAPPGTPARLVGREAIREYARHVVASPLRLEDFEVTELYQTPDPEVVIAEMRAKATVITTGQSVAATSIQILRIRDGQIVLFRDFADPRVLAHVIGEPRPEFARVITAQAGATGIDDLIRFAQEQLPSARQQPGFKGFYLLTDAETGKVITISLWDSREQMAAVEAQGARMTAQAAPAMGVTPLQRETYEVSMQA
jgi:ketosteroid isomerase-like protein/heme-degrading monooxygenase HmoA